MQNVQRNTNDAASISDTGLTCPSCSYNLTAVKENRCPECGKPFRIAPGHEAATAAQQRAEHYESLAAFVICAGTVAIIFSAGGRIPSLAGLAGYVLGMTVLTVCFVRPYWLMRRYPSNSRPVASSPTTSQSLPITLDIKLTPEFLDQFYRRYLLPDLQRWVIATLFGAALVGALLLISALDWLVYAALGAIVVLIIGTWQRIRALHYRQVRPDHVKTIIDVGGVSYDIEGGSVFHFWHGIERIQEFPEMWIVHFRSGGAVILPTDDVPREVLDCFKALWQANAPSSVPSPDGPHSEATR